MSRQCMTQANLAENITKKWWHSSSAACTALARRSSLRLQLGDPVHVSALPAVAEASLVQVPPRARGLKSDC